MEPSMIFDLSHPLREPMPCYPGDPGFKMSLSCSFPLIAAGSTPAPGSTCCISSETDQPDPPMVVRVHALSFGTHTGTHIDAPYHFFPSGPKLHDIPLSQFVGRAVILDVRHLARDRGKISWGDVTNGSGTGVTGALSRIGSRAEDKADIVLLWTGWDVHWGTPTYFLHPYFARDVAKALYGLGAKIVGVDVLNPDETPADENAETEHGWGMHETLLGHGVLICENLKGLGELVGTGSGEKETWVSLMPLSVHDADGAPVRAYGWKQPLVSR
ncbi:putative cyclase [Boletus edulis]|nr:putative cyclase [Boletus edulis]